MSSRAVHHCSPKVIDLYRRCLREIPRVTTVFDIDESETELRVRVRKLFQKHDQVKDPRLIDQLLVLGENELKEITESWKQKSHLYHLLGFDEVETPRLVSDQYESPFLKKFYRSDA